MTLLREGGLMSKILNILLSILLVLFLANWAAGAAWTDNDPADHLWSTPGNWTESAVPEDWTSTRLYPNIDPNNDWPIIQDGIDAISAGLDISWDRREDATECSDPCLTMTGGTLTLGSSTTGESFNISLTDGLAGYFNLSGGFVTNAGIMHLGQTGPGTLNMTGGELTTHLLKVGQRADRTGYAYMNLHGGTLTCNVIDFRPRSLVNITQGTWIINEDVTSAINSAINDGRLTAFDGAGEVLFSYDGAKTTVTATDNVNAYDPYPANDAEDVEVDVTLSWTAAPGATGHDVYFGTDSNNLVLEAANNPTNSYSPDTLDVGVTYYWRIDEIRSSGTSTGFLWNFTADTGIARNPSPEDDAEYVDTEVMLRWTPGVIATSHDIYLGTSPGDLIFKGSQVRDANSYYPGGLKLGQTYYWRIDEVSSKGTVTGQLWSFVTEGIPTEPEPFDGAEFFSTDVTLSWKSGILSGSHDIYFGTSLEDVNNACRPAGDIVSDGQVDFADISVLADQWLSDPYGGGVSGDLNFDNSVDMLDLSILANCWNDNADAAFMCSLAVGTETYNPGALEAGTTYYWRVDEVKGADRYKGELWQFSSIVMGFPAFPEAEGWGSDTLGGRGGQVIKVTNLYTNGDGSLAKACSTAGPRIVVFEVSGVINGNVHITEPYITIAGQTAPGAGITIEGMIKTFGYDVHDVVLRHLRVRRQRFIGSGGDCIQIGGENNYNYVLDHLSISWANDEAIDMYWGHHNTVQWCSIEETDPCGHDKGAHNFAFINAAKGSGAVSLHHNLWAHHQRRVPCMAPYRQNAACDFINNLIYDCYGGLNHAGHQPNIQSPINVYNNYWRKGPSYERIFPFANFDGVDYYITDNYYENWGLKGHPRYWTWSEAPTWVQFNQDGEELLSPAPTPPITTTTAMACFDPVLNKAGCWPRDRVTLRTVDEVINGTGSWERNAPLAPTNAWFMDDLTPTVPPVDTDDDGMPDTWETAHGLNPGNPADACDIVPAGVSPDDRHKDYTFIEYYINELADNLVP